MIRLAAAAYPIERLGNWHALETKLAAWMAEAKAGGADLAVLPEYAGVEAALIDGPDTAEVSTWCVRAADAASDYLDLVQNLAARFELSILSGSCPARGPAGLTNRAYLIHGGRAQPIDKTILTPWEARHTPLRPGLGPKVFDTDLGQLGAVICYDSEFPTLVRPLAADLLLIPSCTDSWAGQSRVEIAARARALEGLCITVQAPLLGAVQGCELVDENYGRAGIYAPPDQGFPEYGILAQGGRNQPGWVFAEYQPQDLANARETGAVAVWRDWPDVAPIPQKGGKLHFLKDRP